MKVLPGINIKREIDDLLEIGHNVGDSHSSSVSNNATTSQTSVSRTRDGMTLLTKHSLGHVNASFVSRLLQTIRLTGVAFAPSSADGDYEDGALWKQTSVGPEPQYYGPSSMEALARHAELYLDQAIDERGHFRYEFSCPPRAESCAYANDELLTTNIQAEIPPTDLSSTLIDSGWYYHTNSEPLYSATVGRPSAFKDLEIDVGDVVEIDDIYWTPELNAPPPPVSQGISPQLVALNYSSRLCTIIGQALQITYMPRSVKVRIGLGTPPGEEWMVRNLNQQLNRWAASIPVNLRLPNPECFAENSVPYLRLVLGLWTRYCFAVIYINRPFVNSKISEIAAVSFHNCCQAARRCVQMVDAYYKVPDVLPLECAIPGIFSSAMVLIIDSIASSPPGQLGARGTASHNTDYNVTGNERDLEKCSIALGRLEQYWKIAGKLKDVIKEFRELWSWHPFAQPTTISESTQPPEEPRTRGLHTSWPIEAESLQFTGLYAQQPASTPTLADGLNPAPIFPNLFVDDTGVLNLLSSQMQSDGIFDESQSFPYDAEFPPGEWPFNSDEVVAPSGPTHDLFPSLPGSEHNWNDTMKSVLRLGENEPGL
ncbi:unnamed protein product [Rhizoctonia solani]|uniref:Transcription factor domain-containing protein n=1 Tax=Rhizoctonia solani TaxID=456999 RepID=A0A8H2ZZZ4_9AGAM|nr:unnamed protein product [Rhizoctonia solani]